VPISKSEPVVERWVAEATEAFVPPGKGRKLNLGCGMDIRDPKEGWVNLDYIALDPSVMEWDLECGKPLPYPDRYFEVIMMVDVLEHMPHRTPAVKGEFMFWLLAEMLRVSKPGAYWIVCSPAPPASLASAGHTRLIDQGTFHEFSTTEPDSSAEYQSLSDYPRLRLLRYDVLRKWNWRQPVWFGRACSYGMVWEVV
jgi:hypothetical protein